MAAAAKNDKDYAVVVGIDEYPGYRSLKGAVADAEDFVKWLCQEEFGGGILARNCRKVVSIKEPLAPLQEQVDEAFDSIFSSIPPGEVAHRLYVYFSGHGMAESNLITDLCLASWAKKFPNRALDAQEYLDTMLKLGKFKEVVMFLDCCRIRIVAVKGRNPDFTAAAPGIGAPDASYFIANATQFTYSSYEAATGDLGDDNEPIVRGYFTRALMAALRGAAARAKGGVTANDLKDYLEENVSLVAKADSRVQDSQVVNGLRRDAVFGSAPPSPGGPPPFPPGPPPVGSDIPPGTPPGGDPKGLGKALPLTIQNDLAAIRLTLRDAANKTVFDGKVPNLRRLKLGPGAYRLRTELDHATFETPIRLDAPLTVSISEQLPSAPELYSAAPLEKSPTSHEYYTQPSMRWSHEPTRPPLGQGEDASLLVFVRAVDKKKQDPSSNLTRGLVLLDREEKQISDFAPSETQRDNRFGWMAFHAAVPEGTYYLRFAGEASEGPALPARELPVQLCPEWQTQVFLMYRGAPLLETTKIFFARPDAGFRPYSAETEAADVALNGLQNNHDLLTEGALNLLLKGKFENPMLGLVGAHVLIQRQRALENRIALDGRKPTSQQAKQLQERRQQISVVLRNLNKLLPSSPDVAALNLLTTPSDAPCTVQIDAPPMLRPGLLAVMNEAATRPDVLKPGSPIPAIAPRVYADTAWSTWAPGAAKGELNWVHFALLDYMKKAMDAGQTGIAREKPVQTLALRLRVPQQTVRQAAMDFATIPVSSLWKALPPEYQNLFRKSRAKTDSSAATLNVSNFLSNLVTEKAELYEKA